MSSVRTYRFPRIDRVVHGVGSIGRVPAVVDELGAHRVLVLTGSTLARHTPVVADLTASLGERVVGVVDTMRQHAPKSDVDTAVAMALELDADTLIGIGGSSVTDATKIVAIEVIRARGDGPAAALPFILVPTTLSAGEYTPAAGMTGEQHGVKTYVVDPRMAPYAVVLDPAITLHTPIELWLSTGVKSIDHACEMLWGPRAHPLPSALAEAALRTLCADLPVTRDTPDDLDARLRCQIAGWMSMSGVINVQVYLSHTLGHQIGARWDVPHGLTSGITLPTVMRRMQRNAPEAVATIARLLGVEPGVGAAVSPEAVADAAADRLRQFVAALGLPTRLQEVGARREDFGAVARATAAAGAATGFGAEFAADEIESMLDQMW